MGRESYHSDQSDNSSIIGKPTYKSSIQVRGLGEKNKVKVSMIFTLRLRKACKNFVVKKPGEEEVALCALLMVPVYFAQHVLCAIEMHCPVAFCLIKNL